MKQITLYNGGHPFSNEDLLFLQSLSTEAILALAAGLVEDSSQPVAVSRAVISESPGNTSITAGWIFYSGIFYRVAATSLAIEGLTNMKFIVDYAPITGSSVIYQDAVARDIYSDAILSLVANTHPSASLFSASALQYPAEPGTRGVLREVGLLSGQLASDIYDVSTGLGVKRWRGWAIADGNNGTNNVVGRFTVGLKAGDAEFGAINQQGGTKTETLDVTQIPQHTHSGTTGSVNGSLDHTHAPGSDNGASFVHANGGASTDTGGPSRGLDEATRRYAAQTGGVIGSNNILDHTHNFTTNGGTGGGLSHNNLPPYYTVFLMQKIS